MTHIGEVRPGSGRAAGRHDWIDPASPGFLRWEPTWPNLDIAYHQEVFRRRVRSDIKGTLASTHRIKLLASFLKE